MSEWAELAGDEVLAVAILDRLLHDAEVITINGPSWRLRGRDELLKRLESTQNSETTRRIPLTTLAEGPRKAHTTPTRTPAA